ncbi:arginase family protein [Verminephrobacter eiseniae]|uniref:arginase family protein n=1 Tax=Verminephrobacter eiseniae TaxID=364317 RepID=UPI0022386ABE|nr:arginase family protein [Verminephrobacter eiseniae]MCW5236194.1 arginase family protein [Verminephrobacter eiseniae]
MIEIIVSQGRVADRAAQMIRGADLTAKALAKRYGVKIKYVGKPSPHEHDDWTHSLPQAKETLQCVSAAIEASISHQPLTLMISNTCSVSLASLPVVARAHPNAVLLWIDAHGDFNTPESTDSGYLGGMVLAGTCGLWDSGHGSGVRPEQVVLVGARDIDVAERQLIEKSGVRIIPPEQVTPTNILQAIGDAPVWIHIDWDVMEPGYLPADYSVPNGLLPRQIKSLFACIGRNRILGIELAEFNASEDEKENQKALEVILDMVSPVFENN